MTINMGWPEWLLVASLAISVSSDVARLAAKENTHYDRALSVLAGGIYFTGAMALLYWGGFFA